MRAKVVYCKEKHNVWFIPHVWQRIKNLALKAANGDEDKMNISEQINNACMAYKATDEENFAEMKREVAIKINALQEQLNFIIKAEGESLERKKNETKKEIDTAFLRN